MGSLIIGIFGVLFILMAGTIAAFVMEAIELMKEKEKKENGR